MRKIHRINRDHRKAQVSTLSQEMAKLEAGVQEEEAKLYLCASVDGVQKLIGQARYLLRDHQKIVFLVFCCPEC